MHSFWNLLWLTWWNSLLTGKINAASTRIFFRNFWSKYFTETTVIHEPFFVCYRLMIVNLHRNYPLIDQLGRYSYCDFWLSIYVLWPKYFTINCYAAAWILGIVRFRYITVKFLLSTHNRHPISQTERRWMGCRWWYQTPIYYLMFSTSIH